MTLVACDMRPSDLDVMTVNGKVESIEQRIELERDDFTASVFYGGMQLADNVDMDFNEDGFIVKMTYYNKNDERTGTYRVEIDEEGYALNSKYESKSGHESSIEYESENGSAVIENLKQVGEGYTNVNGTEGKIDVEYTYDQEGRLIEQYTDQDGHIFTKSFGYEDGFLVHVESDTNNLESVTELEYEDGLLVAYEVASDHYTGDYRLEYDDLDKKGNWTEMRVYLNDEFVGTVVRDIKYY